MPNLFTTGDIMNFARACLTSLLIAFFISACGGAYDDAGTARNTLASSSSIITQAAPAADYATVVQQLYVAYFGRPADPGGLVNFQASLAAAGSPTDIQSLIAAYNTNTAVRQLIDSFGTSTESQTLYAGDNTAFVTAVFNNVLNRSPQSAGLSFWVGALNSGTLSKGNAALSIMAGALGNVTTQGVIDAALVNKKIQISTSFTASLTTAQQIESYKGSAAAAAARSMLASVSGSTDTNVFKSTIDSTVAQLALQMYSGRWEGSYSGDDAGICAIDIATTGNLTGSCYGGAAGTMTISGTVSSSGQLTFYLSDQFGTSPSFTGQFTSSKLLSGYWYTADGMSGTWALTHK
jgi:hypothetical protein